MTIGHLFAGLRWVLVPTCTIETLRHSWREIRNAWQRDDFQWRYRRWRRGFGQCHNCETLVNDVTDVGAHRSADLFWCAACARKAAS